MDRYTVFSLHQDTPPYNKLLAVSDDGYIRLTFAEIQCLYFVHLISGLDEDTPTDISGGAMGGATVTAITGYTEWVTDPTLTPAITLGWDWQMDAACNHIRLRRVNEPRSNIMLQDANRIDIGPTKTNGLLEAFIDAISWQSAVRNFIESA